MIRRSFNQDWAVAPHQSSFAASRGLPNDATVVTLPHDALRDCSRTPDTPNGSHTGYYPGGHFIYTKSFDVPQEWAEKVVVLEFEGAYRDAMVYLNGDFVGQRPNGYAAFALELSPYLNHGGANTVSVEVRTHEDSRWYTGCGLYRNAWLIVSDPVHIGMDGVRVTTPDVDDELARVHVSVEVKNESRRTRTVRVLTTVTGPDGEAVGSGSAPLTILAGNSAVVGLPHYIREPKLWDVDQPHLYQVHTRLEFEDAVLDEDTTNFGIRTLRLDPVHGLRLNGRTIKLRGGCIHHDNGPLGSAAYPRAEERKVEILKEAGFNAVRSAHSNISRAFLDAADRHGLLVWDETFDVWTKGKTSFDYALDFPEWWERDIESMVTKDFNHPSVIMYSIGNEIFEVGSPIGSTWGRALADKVRALDGTRIITNAVNGMIAVIDVFGAEGGEDAVNVNDFMGSMAETMNELGASQLVSDRTEEAFSQLDVAGINYAEARYEVDAKHFPNRISVGSESFPGALDRIWPLVQEHPTVLGDFAWTAWDYLGEASLGRAAYTGAPDAPTGMSSPFPWLLAQSGTVDILGSRRPISYWRETVWGLRDVPYIAVHRPQFHGRELTVGGWSWDDVLSSWSWNAEEGSPILVDVYSDADEIELLINGRTFGRSQVGAKKACIARFDTAYRAGELTAIAYVKGVETGRTTLASASSNISLCAVADRSDLRADGMDLAYIEVTVSDSEGVLANDEIVTVRAEIEGPAELAGFASARPDPAEQFNAFKQTSFDGRLLAIIRPTAVGPIRVSFTATGHPSAVVTLQAQ